MKNNSNKRLPEFDIAKGIAILCVILGHLGIKSINRVVFMFHMPLFFLISGYFLSLTDSFELFSKKKFKQCIIPYIATCAMICTASVPVSMLFQLYWPLEETETDAVITEKLFPSAPGKVSSGKKLPDFDYIQQDEQKRCATMRINHLIITYLSTECYTPFPTNL